MDCYGHKLSNDVLFAHHLILDVPGGSSLTLATAAVFHYGTIHLPPGLSNFTSSEHTAELGLGQGIRLLGWLGTKSRRSAAPHGIIIYCALVWYTKRI